MKKVILCLLLLIPILVILTIDASGKLIASALVDIPVESVVIKRGGAVLESDEINLEDYKDTDKRYSVFCEVFPGIATDQMIWESSDPRIATITPSDTRENSADIHFLDYGSVDILCTSKKNSSISARATLYIGGAIPGYMRIGDYAEESVTSLTMPRYAVKSLVANVKPARSVREEKVQWSSDNESVLKVDNNGVITALAYGEANVRAVVSAKGKTVSATVNVNVEGDALSRESVIYCAADALDLAPYKTDDLVTVEGGEEITLIDTPDFGAKQVVFRKGEATQTVTVVKVPRNESLVIENYYALKEGALSAFIALGTSNIELKAIALNGANPEIVWHSSNESVLIVREGRLYAVGSGAAEIYAAADGYASQRIALNVTSPVEDFRLSENTYRDAVGLLQERVFGNTTYKDGQYTNTFRLKIASVYPTDANVEDAFSFESTSIETATVDKNGLIRFASDVDDRSVTITATAYNQQGMPVRRNYTFHLVNGVNIAIDTPNQHFDASAGEKPDFTPYYDLIAVTSNKTVKSVVLHNDVYFPSRSNGGAAIENLSMSIYGNGKKLDGQFLISSVEETDKLLLWNFDTFYDMPKELKINLINLNMQATQPTSDDAQTAFEELSTKGGGAIGVLGAYPDKNNHFSLYVKGCLFQYAYGHVNTAIGDSEYDGCIFRNNSASAIVLQQSSFGVANAKIKNCIFSNTIAPVGIACGNFNDILARFSGKKGVKSQYGTFELEGKNYVYNWKKLKDVQMNLLPRNLENKNANTLVGEFNDKLGKIIKEAFEMSDLKNLYVEDEEEYNRQKRMIDKMDYLEEHSYLNFSFLMIGIWDDMNPQFNNPSSTEKGIKINFDADQYKAVKVAADMAPSISGLLGFAKMLDVDIEKNETYHIICRDKEGKFNTKPNETYTIGPEIYARLRGE